jgi:hypothetical protein
MTIRFTGSPGILDIASTTNYYQQDSESHENEEAPLEGGNPVETTLQYFLLPLKSDL